jgi:hypothetical protein
MNADFQEIISLTQLGLEFTTSTSDIAIQIPGLTNNLKCLQVTELKIGIDPADVGANFDWITLEIVSPQGGITPASGGKLHTVPELRDAGTRLYKNYNDDHLVLLKLNAKLATMSSKPIVLRIRKADGSLLAKTFVYLRMDLVEENPIPRPYFELPDVDRFQAL